MNQSLDVVKKRHQYWRYIDNKSIKWDNEIILLRTKIFLVGLFK